MTSDEYATLMDFLATRFARIDARLAGIEARQEALEARLTRSEVPWESMRDDLRRVAEGVVAVSERLSARIEVLERWRSRKDSRGLPCGPGRSVTGARRGSLIRPARRISAAWSASPCAHSAMRRSYSSDQRLGWQRGGRSSDCWPTRAGF